MVLSTVSTAPRTRSPRIALAAYAAFGAFGVFWGAWGAALPAIRTQAALSETQLGTALLFVGVGALPAMAVTGRLLDRFGLRPIPILLILLGAAGIAVGSGARDGVSVTACMLAVGATSGAADVAINTLAGHAEHHTGRPVLTRAHGTFSLAVVASSLGTGLLLSQALTPQAVFVLAALSVIALAGTAGVLAEPARPESGTGSTLADEHRRPHAVGLYGMIALIVLGAVGALAYATENAHQSWGAVLLTDAFTAPPEIAALAPATFAATAAAARFASAPLSRSRPAALLLFSGAGATGGTLLLALAPNVPLALAGLAVAAAGTAPLFPTLLSHNLRDIAPSLRARATSTVATTAYLGFLLGPPYVGLIAGALDLRTAFIGVAALALVFTTVITVTGRWTRRALARPTCSKDRVDAHAPS